MSAEIIVDLRDVAVPWRRDAESPSIEGVNWSVREREFWVVGGTQGTGKSDLMFMLAGLTKPIRGAYTLFGQNMGEHFGDEFLPNRLRIGMVFDDERLLNHLTIAENVALPARYHHNLHADEAANWVEALLRATGVAEFAGNTPTVVARHWRRRAALARALALRPEVLFLENPLRGMDWRHTAWWMDFVQRLWRGHDLLRGRPMTVIASTDEFRPWRSAGAQFAILHERTFEVAGEVAPEDEVRTMESAAVAERDVQRSPAP
jgi:ABC-type transporter Mla maintaining outer membrane lipid asymmetry ATPase subunit MlaF